MDFLNHRKGLYGFLSGFLLSPLQCTVETLKGCVSLKKFKSQGKAVELTVNSKEENSSSKNSASGRRAAQLLAHLLQFHFLNDRV
jgi:hypothetical protein